MPVSTISYCIIFKFDSETKNYARISTFKKFKSPGLDGLPKEWYQTFWYLKRYCFQMLVVEIFDHERLSRSQYRGVISLMHKSGDRDYVKDWRPITLLNVDYKIIDKTLATRLKSALPIIIHEDQKGYIEGRNINEANRYVQDIIGYTDKENKEGLIVLVLGKVPC